MRAVVHLAADRSGDRVTLIGGGGDPARRTPAPPQADSSGVSADLQFQRAPGGEERADDRLRADQLGTHRSGCASDLLPATRRSRHHLLHPGRGRRARTVELIRHRVLVAGGIALLIGVVGGYLVARALAHRVKRLERAAERVAGGDFEHPIRVESSDELGELAVAFNDMQRQLHQLESARKKFIATASHELRTPIFSLGGFVELLEDEDLDAETRRRFLDQVRDQVERLRKLSVDLLDLSKLDAGSLELRNEEVDLGELTRSVSGEFEPTLAQHDSRIELRLATRRINAVCDPVRVAQIMRILIDNALTHTPAGTHITVTAARENGSVRLAVRDDGEGIADHAQRRIFEPFFTADDAQGSGLGLTIASELAERMSGQLRVDSHPGDTVFTLELPA